AIGDLVAIGNDAEIDAEVVATTQDGIRCMPLGRMTGIRVGAPVRSDATPHLVPTGNGLFGRVIDGMGRPIDGKGPLVVEEYVSIDHD
ncbi:EscN/YscN/HrcN family type III secretion system ATPase, partial [Cryobacterium sp. 10I1]|nr:EscN/YscN/HrcN family type III secretion system ATPase [Cryobacterium sp. 10I1]